MGIQRFEAVWPATAREAVARQVSGYPMPEPFADSGWSLGCEAGVLSRLRDRLLAFDWDAALARLNRFPQFVASVDGLDVHYIHVRAEREGAPPLLLLHGWPSSPFEFFDIIDRLANPSRHGGDPADAVEVIAPSLPGYGFGGKPAAVIGPCAAADIIDALMVGQLGHDRYHAHGGDWGAVVATRMAIQHPDHVLGLHLTMLAMPPSTRPTTPEEQEWGARFGEVQRDRGGYSHLQGTKPQSLAWLAAGNPMGQIAWIVERYHDWSDLRRRDFDAVYDLDWLLIATLVYVMNDAFASAARFYTGYSNDLVAIADEAGRCEAQTAFMGHLGDPRIIAPPRTMAERAYNIVRWRLSDEGGHFPAHERPDALLVDLIDWIRDAQSTAPVHDPASGSADVGATYLPL